MTNPAGAPDTARKSWPFWHNLGGTARFQLAPETGRAFFYFRHGSCRKRKGVLQAWIEHTILTLVLQPMPLEVLKEAQAEFLDFQNTGMSVIEISHRTCGILGAASGNEGALERTDGNS